MSFKNVFGAEFRELEEREFSGKLARVVAASRTYPTTQSDLWDAITDKHRLSRWFGHVEGTFEPGGKYKIKGNAKGEILWCEPHQGFDLTWVAFSDTSWVNVRLKSHDKGTQLRIEHIMHKSRLSEGHWKKYGPGATGVGWELGFMALGVHLDDGGGSINLSDHERWQETEDAKDLIRACASSWGDAHIADGEAVDSARAMAVETASFYTGF